MRTEKGGGKIRSGSRAVTIRENSLASQNLSERLAGETNRRSRDGPIGSKG